MRTYPNNSPQAAARIVALAMLADGHLCKTELDLLERMDAIARLGLQPRELQAIVHAFCEDLYATSHRTWKAACLDPGTLAALLAEVDDPALRSEVLAICVAVTAADGHVAEGETLILMTASELWDLPRNVSLSRALEPGVGHV